MKTNLILFFINASLVMAICLALSWPSISKPTVEIGQIWEYQNENPFSENTRQLVLDKRNGWVKYVDVKYANHENRELFEWEKRISYFIYNRMLAHKSRVIR